MKRLMPKQNRLCLLSTLFLAWAILLSCVSGLSVTHAETDIFLSGLLLYAKLPEGSAEAKEYGKYPQVKSYDLHGGLAPEKVDVVVIVNGKPSEEVFIVLEVFPIVGLTNWEETEGITEYQLLERSKTGLSGVLRLEKKLIFKGRTEVKFLDIDLKKIINHFVQRGYWPAELIFRATAEPIAGETSLANNIIEFRFPMKPRD